ncbi:hypothetical protein ACFPM0_20795 [Pseudonocardia sulfidoxydans]|uniref:hypothetical protein n=1 Tax=Pseudonocardia sulfidoxydans TaxID=54011 RepID=UPI003612BE0E
MPFRRKGASTCAPRPAERRDPRRPAGPGPPPPRGPPVPARRRTSLNNRADVGRPAVDRPAGAGPTPARPARTAAATRSAR